MNLIKRISLLGKFWEEKINGRFLKWNIFFILFQLIFLFFKFNDLPPLVPLFYSLPWGESQLATASTLFLLPVFSIVIVLINNILAVSFFNSIPLLSRLLVVFSLIFSFLNTVVVVKVINLVS